MGQFELLSDYKPSGDQPDAIKKLVESLQKENRHQTLLGATGTGKSVGWDEPVTVDTGDGLYRGTIGALLDPLLSLLPDTETQVAAPPKPWRVLAWDSETGTTEWRSITALSRHKSPDTLHTLKTDCGRRVTLTADHSVWTLRAGQLHLLPGNEVRTGDALPVPRRLPEPETPRTSLALLPLLASSQGRIGAYIPALSGRDDLNSLLRPHYPVPHEKAFRVRNAQETIHLDAAKSLLDDAIVTEEDIFLRAGNYRVHAVQPLTPAFATVLGQYLAEGHSAAHFSLISVREEETSGIVAAALSESGIPFFQRKDGDFVVGARVWHELFLRLMGTHAGNKRLPAFWVEASNSFLAAMLRAYFEGDGGIDRGAVTAVTLSAELAADLQEALLRFGIWARVRAIQKKKPNGDYGTYHKITISGGDNLHRYAERIGFLTQRKTTSLLTCLKDPNTNVDLVYGVGERLKAEREARGLLQKEISTKAECCRAMISAIECGKRHPSRALFLKICAALEIDDLAFVGLANVFWATVASNEEVTPTTPYVYDFSVEGYETFLTGRGGLFVHNTFTVANIIQQVQRPTLVMAHNKTLAAQLCSEFRDFFPKNAVEYFVSYYDYYQPEAYIPQTDTFIEKDSQINDEIDRLRHSATQSLLERRDVIVVSSVSCIYGLGSPEEYQKIVCAFKKGLPFDREEALTRLVAMQFTRNNMELTRGTFRVRGDTLEIQPADEEIIVRVEFFGDEVEKITLADPLTGEVIGARDTITIFPASHFVAGEERLKIAMKTIEAEMYDRIDYFKGRNELIEAQRIEQRTKFDLEMIRELGYCSGIENYSRHLDGRVPGTAPHTLLDYFPKDFLLVVDESHQTLPQIRGMYNGDKARKDVLINYGFRLPSAADNRPLKWHEFEERIGQAILVSATPGPFEKENSTEIVEQIIRPTGLIDPEVVVKPTKGQIDDLIEVIRATIEKEERVLVTTLTKKMAEDLTEYLEDLKIKVNYLHSDIKTMERTEILRNLRLGVYDVLVGINLLREGLDLPEVSTVAILDADKEGFLRSETSLIQTIGRAARNIGGKVILYADNITGSMERAIQETNRRREKQVAYNEEHGITPYTVKKAVRDLIAADKVAEETNAYSAQNAAARLRADPATMSMDQVEEVIRSLEKEMKEASRALNFEYAAEVRDEINELRKFAPKSEVGKNESTTKLGKDSVQYKPKRGKIEK